MVQRLDQLLQCCTVKITVPGQMGWGTGFFVAPGLILTCAHVVKALKPDATAEISWQQQEGFAEAVVTQLTPQLDLALLKFLSPPDLELPCVYLGEDFRPNDDFYTFGYPDNFPQGTSVTGLCEGSAIENNSPLVVFKSGQIRPGLSGSPLLNLKTGKVCGIVKFTRDRSIDLGGGAIPTMVILEQFQDLREQQQQFHEGDRRWSGLLQSVVVDFGELLSRIEAGTATTADIQCLREVLMSRPSQVLQLGKYNINLGQGQNIQIGDRTYVEINEAAIEAIVATIRQSPSPTPIKGIPHNLPRTGAAEFVGRDTALRDLHGLLQQNERVAITAIAGMGGIGKSELALQYADYHLKQQTYPAGMCWLDAQELEVGTKLVQLATSWFNLVPPDNLDLPGQVGFCWRRWASGEALVVFDGLNTAADYERIAPYLPPTDTRFKVLITTRERIGAPVVRLDLDVLFPRAALKLLESLISRERLRQEPWIARQLCKRLGYLPLGLELVGRYLAQDEDLTLAEMTLQLEAEGLTQEALAERDPRMTAKLGVEAAFELSWKALTSEAQQLSYLLGLFAPVTIPWSLVERCLEENQRRTFNKARRSLLNLSLLKRQNEGIYRLHPLIRNFFEVKRKEQEKLDQFQIDTLKQQFCQGMASIAQEIPYPSTYKQVSTLTDVMPHIVEAATTWKELLTDDNLLSPYPRLGSSGREQKLNSQDELWRDYCLNHSREQFEKHTDVATSLGTLAFLYLYKGRYTQAEPLLVQALKLRQKSLGDEHLDTAINLHNLAVLYQGQGRYKEAESLFMQALDLNKRLLGEKHFNTITTQKNLEELQQIIQEQWHSPKESPRYPPKLFPDNQTDNPRR